MSWASTVRRRRLIFGALVILTMIAAIAAMTRILAGGGLTLVELGMLLCCSATIPWIVIGYWNAIVGLVLALTSRNSLEATAPFVQRVNDSAPITTRNAIVMPVYNENPGRVFEHIERILSSLDDTGQAGSFEFFLLSDTNVPEIAAEEEERFAALLARDRRPARLHYRRRRDNVAQKPGNLRDFCDRWGKDFDHMIVLDADSVMTGEVLLRMVRTMQANERLGILQTLIVGLPARSAFARIFQFGMRQGMRTYTLGSTWWSGADGPYWGHNAIIRLAPFMAHCTLPILPGKPPLGGRVLSHDQLEAVMMCRAGYEVRVLPEECGSFEENPPTILDFIQRDLRWCQGNMQYLKLLDMPGLRPIGRLQLVLAILMYLAAPFWLGFVTLSLGQCIAYALGAESTAAPMIDTFWGNVSAGSGLLFFAVMMGMTFAPKLMGVAEILLRPSLRRAYGGSGRVAVSALVEFVFSVLMAPIIAVAHSIFIIGLFFGRRITWEAQDRDGQEISFGRAFRAFWPQTLAGTLGTVALTLTSPHVMPFAAPILVPLILAVPFAHITSRRDFGRLLASIRLCPMPEELAQTRRIVFGRQGPVLASNRVEGLPIVAEPTQVPPPNRVHEAAQDRESRWV